MPRTGAGVGGWHRSAGAGEQGAVGGGVAYGGPAPHFGLSGWGRRRDRAEWNRDPADRRVGDGRVPGKGGVACGSRGRPGHAVMRWCGVDWAGHAVAQAAPFRLKAAGLAKEPV